MYDVSKNNLFKVSLKYQETDVILQADLKRRKQLFSYFGFTMDNIPAASFLTAIS